MAHIGIWRKLCSSKDPLNIVWLTTLKTIPNLHYLAKCSWFFSTPTPLFIAAVCNNFVSSRLSEPHSPVGCHVVLIQGGKGGGCDWFSSRLLSFQTPPWEPWFRALSCTPQVTMCSALAAPGGGGGKEGQTLPQPPLGGSPWGEILCQEDPIHLQVSLSFLFGSQATRWQDCSTDWPSHGPSLPKCAISMEVTGLCVGTTHRHGWGLQPAPPGPNKNMAASILNTQAGARGHRPLLGFLPVFSLPQQSFSSALSELKPVHRPLSWLICLLFCQSPSSLLPSGNSSLFLWVTPKFHLPPEVPLCLLSPPLGSHHLPHSPQALPLPGSPLCTHSLPGSPVLSASWDSQL